MARGQHIIGGGAAWEDGNCWIESQRLLHNGSQVGQLFQVVISRSAAAWEQGVGQRRFVCAAAMCFATVSALQAWGPIHGRPHAPHTLGLDCHTRQAARWQLSQAHLGLTRAPPRAEFPLLGVQTLQAGGGRECIQTVGSSASRRHATILHHPLHGHSSLPQPWRTCLHRWRPLPWSRLSRGRRPSHRARLPTAPHLPMGTVTNAWITATMQHSLPVQPHLPRGEELHPVRLYLAFALRIIALSFPPSTTHPS